MQHWLEGQSAFVVHGWWLEQASNGPQWQALRSACTQQLHAPPGGCPWQPIVKLHGVFRSHPQGSFTHPPYAANAGVLMLVRIGAVQAAAAPAFASAFSAERSRSPKPLSGVPLDSFDHSPPSAIESRVGP